MKIRKADGAKFEKQFKKTIEGEFYIRRLPTLNTGNTGQTQPADFFVIGKNFNYVELKTTTADSFSITSMQQYAEILEFLELKKKYHYGMKMNYWIIVQFEKYNIIKILSAEEAIKMSNSHKAVRYNSDELLTTTSIEEIKERLKL